jgi:deoxyadenosine/deoxycytidine kinase
MAKLFEQPRFIAVEGPIRVGKSSLAQHLAKTLHARRIVEPENNPFLDRFYSAEPGMAFAAQMWFLAERYEQLRQAKNSDEPVVADYIFEKDRYYQMFREQLPAPDLVIYLQATPEVLKQRLKRKGIGGERAISDAYIEQIAAAYEHFFFHYTASDLLIVNTSDIDFVNNNKDLKLLMKRLSEPIKGTQYFLPLGENAAD